MNGTVLSETPVDPIVPFRGLVDLGCTITWSCAGCVVKHPRLGKIECWLRSGCPVVRKDHALALITEIERMDTKKRTNRRFMLEESDNIFTKISSLLMNQQWGILVSVQKFQTFAFQKFQDKTIKARGRHLQKRLEAQTRGVHRQKSQPGTSTKFGRHISKCKSGTRSTSADFKGKIHEGDCAS